MSHGDSRTTSSMVGLKTVVRAPAIWRVGPRPAAVGCPLALFIDAAWPRPSPPRPVVGGVPGGPCDLPPQPKMIRSASCSAAASTIPSAAWRPIRTIGWIVVPSGAKSSTRWSRRRAWRARVAPSDSGMPSGTSTMPSAVSSPARRSRSDAPRRTSSSAVSGFATGIRIRAGSGERVAIRSDRPSMPRLAADPRRRRHRSPVPTEFLRRRSSA